MREAIPEAHRVFVAEQLEVDTHEVRPGVFDPACQRDLGFGERQNTVPLVGVVRPRTTKHQDDLARHLEHRERRAIGASHGHRESLSLRANTFEQDDRVRTA